MVSDNQKTPFQVLTNIISLKFI